VLRLSLVAKGDKNDAADLTFTPLLDGDYSSRPHSDSNSPLKNWLFSSDRASAESESLNRSELIE
jgi:hypothetical protein